MKIRSLKSSPQKIDGMKFYEGQQKITNTLANILVSAGSLEANDVARETFHEYQAAPGKTLFDYGILVGCLEWMNSEDGRRSS